LRVANQQYKLNCNTQPYKITLNDPNLFQYTLIFLQGRNDFHLDQSAAVQLRTFLERGGMLFVDSLCSSQQFSDSFRKEMATIFPNQAWETIPPDHPLFTTEFGGEDVTTVSLRQPSQQPDREPVKAAIRRTQPALEGLKLDDRYAVIFSPYDVTCALS